MFASIQKLRQQAKNVGTLKSSPQQEVETKTTSAGQEVIVIEPTNPQIVYVPQYNTEVVYTQAPTTVVVVEEDDDADEAIAAGLIGFTAGIVIGAAIDNNYYYGPYGFHGGGYMYNDAWDDYYDNREDAREDWQDQPRGPRRRAQRSRGEPIGAAHRARREATQEQRTDRQQTRQENRPSRRRNEEDHADRTRLDPGHDVTGQRADRTGSAEARGYGDGSRTRPRSRLNGAAVRTHSRDIRAANRNARPVREDNRAGQLARWRRPAAAGERRRGQHP